MNNPQMNNQPTTIAPGVDEAPMAVYPLNSSAKLDQEPNPFEKSFSGATIEDTKAKDSKLTLPPVAAITSPSPLMPNTSTTSVIGGGILPKEVTNQFTWDTLRTGPLSPSMLQGPVNAGEYVNFPAKTSSFTPAKMEQQLSTTTRSRQSSTNSINNRKRSASQTESIDSSKSQESSEDKRTKRKSTKTSTKDTEDDEKRRNFLERNRIAALKCRQRKKQWLNNLQAKVEFLTSDNERLQLQSEALKQEIVNLKTLLLAHKDCPIAQANGFNTNSIHKGGMLLTTTDMMRPTASFQQPNTNATTQFPQQSNNNNQPIMTANGSSSSVIRF